MYPIVTFISLYACVSWTLALIAELEGIIQNKQNGNEVLPEDTTHLIQRLCYQRRNLCQDPAGNWITQRCDDCKETQTAVVWPYFAFIGSGQIIFHGTGERGRKQGRQRKMRENNIWEWTGLEFGKSQRVVVNSENCRKLVVKSSVVPQRPFWLREWWWWWWW